MSRSLQAINRCYLLQVALENRMYPATTTCGGKVGMSVCVQSRNVTSGVFSHLEMRHSTFPLALTKAPTGPAGPGCKGRAGAGDWHPFGFSFDTVRPTIIPPHRGQRALVVAAHSPLDRS